MSVRARVRCFGASGSEGYKNVSLHAVYSSDPADPNYSYSQATPSASFNLTISNPAAAAFFEEGVEYDVHFTRRA